MGYTTNFEGKFTITPALTPEQTTYLLGFSDTRRMARSEELAAALPDPRRVAVGLPIGTDGAYFTGGAGDLGQDRDPSILDYNRPSKEQPSLWCQWVPTADGTAVEWDGNENFYNYVEWLQYLVTHFLKPWGCAISGEVKWRGEDMDDRGLITVTDSCISTQALR